MMWAQDIEQDLDYYKAALRDAIQLAGFSIIDGKLVTSGKVESVRVIDCHELGTCVKEGV